MLFLWSYSSRSFWVIYPESLIHLFIPVIIFHCLNYHSLIINLNICYQLRFLIKYVRVHFNIFSIFGHCILNSTLLKIYIYIFSEFCEVWNIFKVKFFSQCWSIHILYLFKYIFSILQLFMHLPLIIIFITILLKYFQ